MVNGISNSSPAYSPDMVYAAMIPKSNAGTEVATSMLQKSLDTQLIALTQLLQQMGVGNNIDSLA
jgi:hypothetical protein